MAAAESISVGDGTLPEFQGGDFAPTQRIAIEDPVTRIAIALEEIVVILRKAAEPIDPDFTAKAFARGMEVVKQELPFVADAFKFLEIQNQRALDAQAAQGALTEGSDDASGS